MGEALPKYPQLREHIDIQFERSGKDAALVLRCLLGVSPQVLALNPASLPILQQLDGKTSLDELILRARELQVQRDDLLVFLQSLNEQGFLAGEQFDRMLRTFREDFLTSPVRAAALAGGAYAATREKLSEELRSYLAGSAPRTDRVGDSAWILKSPHIDYFRGSKGYASVWPIASTLPETLIVIGTSHQYSRLLFHLTKKHFDTPLGLVETDQEFVASLSKRYGDVRAFRDEILHKKEHSLELQLPFLKLLHPKATIVPILVSGFHQYFSGEDLLRRAAEYDEFVTALARTIEDYEKQGRKVAVVAGVDMSHVGQFFGDKSPLNEEFLAEVEREDQAYLSALGNMDLSRLFENVAGTGDARRVCGFSTMYTVLDLSLRLEKKTSFELYRYEQAVNYENDCAVTFAGAAFFETASEPAL